MSSITGITVKSNFAVTQHIWHKAWDNPKDNSWQSCLAKIACIVFPILFTVALVEGILLAGRKVQQLFSDPSNTNLPSHIETIPAELLDPNDVQTVITLKLNPGSSQYDIVKNSNDPRNQRPPACTFHALFAAVTIAQSFPVYADEIRDQHQNYVSNLQQGIIELGTEAFFQAVDPNLKGGWDLKDIKEKWPQFLQFNRLHLKDTNEDTDPVAKRTQAIAEHLFAQPEDPKMKRNIAWIKNGNDESFAVICHQNEAIVFDSHKNEITLISGKEPTRGFLTEKLEPFADMREGMDYNSFSYALGNYQMI